MVEARGRGPMDWDDFREFNPSPSWVPFPVAQFAVKASGEEWRRALTKGGEWERKRGGGARERRRAALRERREDARAEQKK